MPGQSRVLEASLVRKRTASLKMSRKTVFFNYSLQSKIGVQQQMVNFCNSLLCLRVLYEEIRYVFFLASNDFEL